MDNKIINITDPLAMGKTSAREYAKAYEDWYQEHPAVFRSELQAIRQMLPDDPAQRGLEIGTGTGMFSQALGVRHGVESSAMMRRLATQRGIDVTNAAATDLPFKDESFDYVMLNLCNPFIYSIYFTFSEAYRVLKTNGAFIVCFMEKDSAFGKYYQDHRRDNLFYYFSNFFSTQKIMFELSEAGFRKLNVGQTLLNSIAETVDTEAFIPGYGRGSFIVVKAIKQKKIKGTSFNLLSNLN